MAVKIAAFARKAIICLRLAALISGVISLSARGFPGNAAEPIAKVIVKIMIPLMNPFFRKCLILSAIGICDRVYAAQKTMLKISARVRRKYARITFRTPFFPSKTGRSMISKTPHRNPIAAGSR